MKNSRRTFLKSTLATVAATALPVSFGTSANPRKDNILFITIDDLNAWIMGKQRHPLVTCNNIDKLMNRSVRFTNAHCAAPVCASSRAALMTGVAPHISGLYTNAQSVTTGARRGNAHSVIADVMHLPQLLKREGYRNLGAGKIYHRWVSDEEDHSKHYDTFMPEITISEEVKQHGDGYAAEKFYPFPTTNPIVDKLGIKVGNSLVAGPVDRETNMINSLMPDEIIANWLAQKLNNEKSSKPFFMAGGFLRPHVPYTAPQKYFDAIDIDNITLPSVDDMKDIPEYGIAMTMGLIPGGDHKAVLELGETYWKELIQGYLASIAFVDDQVGVVLKALEESGKADDTWIFVMSDHGQNFGEKENWRKMCLWDESTRTPLIICPPGGLSNPQTCNEAVSLLDIYPTICDIVGLPKHNKIFGESLLPQILNPQASRSQPVLVSWHYKNFAVKSNRWKLIQYRDGQEELYDFKNDPLEQENLSGKPQFDKIAEQLRQHIPTDPALPIGQDEWKGDQLDKFVSEAST
ncbi:sulfatase-like hydrolase/transferase [Ningiella sp. W23]|uniref:sulfatase-like hydrolase/transferase n=1 Tax=Ningiella sp. W23 TaxID=3023715 RepID=UPI0037562F4E